MWTVSGAACYVNGHKKSLFFLFIIGFTKHKSWNFVYIFNLNLLFIRRHNEH